MNSLSSSPSSFQDEPLESWRRAWRQGFAPLLSTEGLEALAKALKDDDARLLQGQTTEPPPLLSNEDDAVEGGCPLCVALWQFLLMKVGILEAKFSLLCNEADKALGESAASRYLLNWVDDTPREQMRALLLAEVLLALAARAMDAEPALEPAHA